MGEIEFFYADPVDADGNVIATARMWNVVGPWGAVTPTKIPAAEMALHPDATIHVDLTDKDSP